MTAIAIVGIGCRFGGAPDTASFWDMLRAGRHAFGPVPPDRWDADTFRAVSARDPDRTTAPSGAFLDDVRTFPALALGIPPRRVEVMDPQQRFALETAIEAIEDSGRRPTDLPRQTGVYVGITAHEFRLLHGARVTAMMMASGAFGTSPVDPDVLARAIERVIPPRPFSAPGVLGNMPAAAVSQELDLTGPAYTVDAACASAMVAVSNAVDALRAGRIDAALAGGAYLQLNPEHYVAFTRIGAMSSSGVCRPFDQRADGFVQGDGVGMVLLKRLSDALADGDRIYAVIHGVATNNDGRGDGPMAPLAPGQEDVIRRAWRDADLDPARASQIEAHGTGTGVGDVTEISALKAVFGDAPRLYVGSSKANVGHTMSTAGMAGLIKAALSVHHAEIPPLASFEDRRDDLGLAPDDAFLFPTEPTPWTDTDRLVGVSSFGFGGTNGHAVLGAAPAPEASSDAVDRVELFLFSAADEDGLRTWAGRLRDAIRRDPNATVAGVARALARRRPQRCRAAFAAASRVELLSALHAFATGAATLPADLVTGTADDEPPRIAFLYPGQGAQRVGMLTDIARRFPVVRDTLDRVGDALSADLAIPLHDLLWPDDEVPVDEAEQRLTATEHCQPAMYAAGLALTALLDQVGVKPVVTAGHSLGEFVAAAVSEVAEPHALGRYVARRGRAMAGIQGDPGAMAAVMAEEEVVRGLLVPGAVIANVNHPRQLVVSGTSEAVRSVLANAASQQIVAKALDVSHAFHSPIMDALDAPALLNGLRLDRPGLPIASGIVARPYRTADDARDVFLRHATSPVRFPDALAQCAEAGATLYLQVGAGGPLASFARGAAPRPHRGVLTLASMDDHDGGRSLLVTLGRLWCLGVDLDVRPITAQAPMPILPPTPLPRETYWVVQDSRTRTMRLDGVPTQAVRPDTTPAPMPEAPPAPATPVDDDVLDGVIAVVAKVSAYPVDSLRPSMKLMDDLGFDSLMIGDLATGLAERFPGLGGIPQELLLQGPTVADLVDFVRTGGSATDADDDAPLRALAPVWVDAPRPPPSPRPEGPWTVLGPDASHNDAVALALRDAGVDASVDPAAAAVCLVWVDVGNRPAPADVLGGAPRPDPATPLLAALSARSAPTDVIALTRADDPWTGGLHGALRALSREWADQSIFAVQSDDPCGISRRLPAERDCAERTIDRRLFANGARQVPGLAAAPATPSHPVTADDVVLVTGGTRGLGLRIGLRLAGTGATVILVGRRAPDPDDAAILAAFPAVHARTADVTDRDALRDALAGAVPTVVVHAAGVLADGPIEALDAAAAARAISVKVDGWLNALTAGGDALRVAVALGSQAGRFGNRHQTAYAAANAMLADLVAHAPCRATIVETGPWTGSAMADTIPAPVKAAMRAEGVAFVGPESGLSAVDDALAHGRGVQVLLREEPASLRQLRVEMSLSTAREPFLLDHAIDGTPILPLASVADLLAAAAQVPYPLSVDGLTLYRGVTVAEPVELVATVDRGRARLLRADGVLHDEARVAPASEIPEAVPTEGGDAPTLSLEAFYAGITFHGPLLQGIVSIDAVGPDFVRGVVRAGRPSDWSDRDPRDTFTVDPLALDSAMQLAASVAYTRHGRAGTPVAFGRIVALRATVPGEALTAHVRFGPAEGDRFTCDIDLLDADGSPVLLARDVVAELRKVEAADPAAYTPRAEDTDIAAWPEVADLALRLEGVAAMGLRDPYQRMHDGTAKDTTLVDGRELLHFSGYNYLGLSGDPRILADVSEAVRRWGTSVSASRVASGERPFHRELERELADAQGAEDALLYTAGHATNVSTIGHLFGPEDLILHDAYIHDSALQGIKLSGAARRSYRHEDPDHLETTLKALRGRYRRCLIVVEGVYSMDGDITLLDRFLDLKRRYGCLLMVDEAHSFGVIGATGCGAREHFGIDGRQVDLWMGTLSKSLASCGGWIAGSKSLIQYLRYTSPGFVYSAGLTPANGVAALSALRLMRAEPERVQTLQANARTFHAACARHGLDTGPSRGGSAVVPVITGNSMHALVLSARLKDEGINVQPIVYPAVPDDAARLRFFLSSLHSTAQLEHAADTVARVLAGVREDFPLP